MQLGEQALLTTLPRISTEWSVIFKFKPTTYSRPGTTSLNVENQMLTAVEMLNFLKIEFNALRMYVQNQARGYPAFNIFDTVSTYGVPKLGEWTQVEVRKYKVAEESQSFFLKIYIGGIQIHSEILQRSKDFENVEVYTGPTYHMSASIKDMVIKTKK